MNSVITWTRHNHDPSPFYYRLQQAYTELHHCCRRVNWIVCFFFLELVFLLDPGIDRSVQLLKARYVFITGGGETLRYVITNKRGTCVSMWAWAQHTSDSAPAVEQSFKSWMHNLLQLCMYLIESCVFFHRSSQTARTQSKGSRGFMAGRFQIPMCSASKTAWSMILHKCHQEQLVSRYEKSE